MERNKRDSITVEDTGIEYRYYVCINGERIVGCNSYHNAELIKTILETERTADEEYEKK